MPNYNDAPWVDSTIGRIRVVPLSNWTPENLDEIVYCTSSDSLYMNEGIVDVGVDMGGFTVEARSSSAIAEPSITLSAYVPGSTNIFDVFEVTGLTLGNGTITCTRHMDHRRCCDLLITLSCGTTTGWSTPSFATSVVLPVPPEAGSTDNPGGAAVGTSSVAAFLGGYGSYFDSSAGLTYPLLVSPATINFSGTFGLVNAASAASATRLDGGSLPTPGAGDVMSLGMRFAARWINVLNRPRYY
jgi:hypothetical protein